MTDTGAYGELLAPYASAKPGDATLRPVSPANRMLLSFTSGSTGRSEGGDLLAGAAGRGGRLAGAATSGCVRTTSTTSACRCSTATPSSPTGHRRSRAARRSPCATGSPPPASCPTYGTSAPRTSPTWGGPCSTCWPLPSATTTAITPLRLGFGTEAGAVDAARFEARFGVRLVEGYGSSEGGAAIQRTPDTPAGAIGRAAPGDDLAVVDPETGRGTAGGGAVGGRAPAERCRRHRGVGQPRSEPLRGLLAPPGGGRGPARAAAGTAPATSSSATRQASCTSPAARTTGSASTARTSPPR